MVSVTKFVPLTLEGIEEGEYLQDVNAALVSAMRALIAYKRRFGADVCKGVKARVTAKITLAFEGRDETDFSVKGEVGCAMPVRPARVTVAIEGEEQDEQLSLFVRRTGSTKDTPLQGVLVTRQGHVVDQQTGEVTNGDNE